MKSWSYCMCPKGKASKFPFLVQCPTRKNAINANVWHYAYVKALRLLFILKYVKARNHHSLGQRIH